MFETVGWEWLNLSLL